MSYLSVGEQHERLGSFILAIKYFACGKQVAEHFGTEHPLYTKCVNAIGLARLKSKLQTKEVHKTQGQDRGEKDALPLVIHSKEEKNKNRTRTVNDLKPSKRINQPRTNSIKQLMEVYNEYTYKKFSPNKTENKFTVRN